MKWTDKDRQPQALTIDPSTLPAPLKQGQKLVLWRWTWLDGRGEWTKVPLQPNGRNASVTNPDTWTTWALAWAAYQTGGFSGIGRVLDGTGSLVCIDLDDCVDGTRPNAWARSMVERFDTYVEWSPTGTGLHIWVAGEWPNKGQRNGHVEVYRSDRYITLSGYRAGPEEGITAQPRALEAWRLEHFKPRVTATPPPAPAGDDELIERAREANAGFAALFDGDTGAYGNDDSRADQALANHLVWWTDHDLERADRLFRRSRLMRDKWDSKRNQTTYGWRTLEEADNTVIGGYDPTATSRTVVGRGLVEDVSVPATAPPTKFPLDVLPPILRNWTLTISDWLQTPPEVPATFALAAISGAIGFTYQIAPRSTYFRSALLWTGVVGLPGVIKKSPSLEAATRPLHEWQHELASKYRIDYAKYKGDLEEWEKAPKADRGEKPQPPAFGHCLVNDVTLEKLAQILNETPRGVLQERDELIGWVNAMNQYRGGAGADRQAYLSIWPSAPIKVDRKANPEPYYVRHPYVAITGGIQPATLRLLPHRDGLFERVNWCWPTPIKMALPTEKQPSMQPIRDYAHLIHNLLQLDFPPNEDARFEPHTVSLTPGARDLWDRLDQVRHIDVMNEDPERASRVAKVDGQAASLTLILHMIRFQSGDWIPDDRHADERSVQGGWDLASYYLAQSERIFEVASGSEMDEAGWRILRWMERQGKTTTTRRDVMRATLPGLNRASIVAAAFENLADHGLGVVTKKEKGKPGPAQMTFSTNPYTTTLQDRTVGEDEE